MNTADKRRFEFTKRMFSIPTPPDFVDKKQGRYAYLRAENSRDWLNFSTDNFYNQRIIAYGVVDYKGVCTKDRVPFAAWCVMEIEIPGLGVRHGLGSCSTFYKNNDEIAAGMDTVLKGAASDALKRTLNLFGPGQDLYPDSDIRKPFPSLPSEGIGVLRQLLNLEPEEFFEKVSELLGKEISRDDAKADAVLCQEVFDIMYKFYINEGESE